jgi:arylsulfatase A-like enzyme
MVVAAAFLAGEALAGEAGAKPNLVFILADDLGYGDLGCYGQKLIQTPHVDRMAAGGIRFTQFYAGSTVCAPSRCVLMTGLHTGHCQIRGNAKNDLVPEAVTVAEVLKGAGYATALIGKWGLGNTTESAGHPNRQGFDYFFGYLDQRHAHNHFPAFLWRDGQRVDLPNECVSTGAEGSGYATKRVAYAGDLFAREALAFVEKNRDRPFFLYLSLVVPHANNERTNKLGDGNEVPDHAPYEERAWPPQNKGLAAMITRMDGDVGRLLGKLAELGIDRRTLVLFSSDNGPHHEGGQDMAIFDSNGPLRGIKRDLTDGGIRVPMLGWWPGTIAPGTVSNHVGYFGDLFATAAELAGVPAPAGLDSISFLPALRGAAGQRRHDYLYWEFHEGGSSQAVLIDGRWKGIRLRRRDAPLALYDLANDIGESRDVAANEPAVCQRIEAVLAAARRDSPDWPLRDARK